MCLLLKSGPVLKVFKFGRIVDYGNIHGLPPESSFNHLYWFHLRIFVQALSKLILKSPKKSCLMTFSHGLLLIMAVTVLLFEIITRVYFVCLVAL